MQQQPPSVGRPNPIWVVVLVGILVLWGWMHSSHNAPGGASPAPYDTSNPGMDAKAVYDVSSAETTAGGFSDKQRNEYRRGVQHLINNHRKPSEFTISEVIWGEDKRETSSAPSSSSTSVSTTSNDENYCNAADTYERQSSSDLNQNDYRGAYNNAVSGLAKNENCSDETDQLVNKGYLLSMKGMAEQHLSEGDSRTDLNQADMLLEECTTKPGLYGASEGAGCETQQQYNIKAETNAEINE